MKKIIFIIGIVVLLSLVIVSGQTNINVCCEKTKAGAYCVNTEMSQCDASFKSSPTACSSTEYCALGTCYDSVEGICMQNTPKNICNDNGGTWSEKAPSELEQCQLGCCILNDQVAFIPKVRCMRLATLKGISIDYKASIKNELECIGIALNQEKGACVYTEDFQRKCKITTREDCQGQESYSFSSNDSKSGQGFYSGYLCSAEELNTVCARQTNTECFDGKVYWLDSCGNRENVYSSSLDKSWNNGKFLSPDEICNPNNGNDVNCGNCDYLLGTRCQEYDKSETNQQEPSSGNYYCKATECEDREGNVRKNGESWCVYEGPTGEGDDLVGSRHYRELCIDGEVILEPCAEYRNERCIQSSIETSSGDFSTAGCRVNRWQDCVVQLDKESCENEDSRDCSWVSIPTNTAKKKNACVPKVSPGLKFWEVSQNSSEGGSAVNTCALGTITCKGYFEQTLFERWSASGNENYNDCRENSKAENCECLREDWAVSANEFCTSLGDCGGYVNIKGQLGENGYTWNLDGKTNEFSKTSEQKIIQNAKPIGLHLVGEMK
jgi:hypothetical protein